MTHKNSHVIKLVDETTYNGITYRIPKYNDLIDKGGPMGVLLTCHQSQDLCEEPESDWGEIGIQE